ncbi:MAG: MATE family efflux transporter [Muribaculaceae bacterium]|nr:MATE family efflux transporter [Muribaculaceae bacterium]
MKEDSVKGNLNILGTASVGRLLWQYSLPTVVGLLVMSLYNVVDRIFIGRGVGAEAISGLAITFPVMNLTTALGVLVGAGATARISIFLGRKELDRASMVLGNAFVLLLINAIIYISFFGIYIDPILRAFGASDITLPYARDFILWMLPGLLMTNLAFGFNNIMRASGYPRRAMMTMILGALINLALAPLFIFTFGLGIKGAAIASDIAMTCSMIFVMAHFLRRDVTLHFTPGTYRLKWKIVIGIISIGAAPALVNAASCFINVIINKSLLKYGGDTAIGAAGIFSTYTSLIVMIIIGICQGMQAIIGYNYGAGRLDRLKRTFWLATAVTTGICTAGSLIGLCFPSLIAKAFTSDRYLVDVTVDCLTHALLAFAVVGFQIVSTTFFQSIGSVGKSIFLSLARQVIFLIPLLMTLPGKFGLTGVWLSFPGSDLLATVVTAAMIYFEFKRINSKLIR